MDIEPIHEIDPDELQHGLDCLTPSELILEDLALAIKKSLAFFFPRLADRIYEIGDAVTAIKAKHWADRFQPLREGVEALRTIYSSRDELRETNLTIKEYAGLARHYFQAPLAEAERKRRHAHRDKKNRALRKYATQLMQKKPSRTAAELWRRLPYKSNPAIIDGWAIFRDCPESGTEKIYCVSPAGKETTVNDRAFREYFKAIKKVGTITVNVP